MSTVANGQTDHSGMRRAWSKPAHERGFAHSPGDCVAVVVVPHGVPICSILLVKATEDWRGAVEETEREYVQVYIQDERSMKEPEDLGHSTSFPCGDASRAPTRHEANVPVDGFALQRLVTVREVAS